MVKARVTILHSGFKEDIKQWQDNGIRRFSLTPVACYRCFLSKCEKNVPPYLPTYRGLKMGKTLPLTARVEESQPLSPLTQCSYCASRMIHCPSIAGVVYEGRRTISKVD